MLQVLPLPTIQEVQIRQDKRHLYRFVRSAWEHIEQVDFVDNWHIGAICEHLQAVWKGDIQQLLINVPPGCSKSLITSVFFPAWCWANDPSKRFFYASYDQKLSTRDSVKCRTLVESNWYQRRFPGQVTLKHDQDQKTYYETIAGGFRLATSIGGHGTGQHPDFIVLDDPHSVMMAESEKERQTALDWWDQTMSTRGVSRGVRRIIIMQRLHEEDLSGHVLKHGGWDHLCLPMRYGGSNRSKTKLGFTDPRQTQGELLSNKQFTEEMVGKLENALGPYAAAGQLGQDPVPRKGGFFKVENVEIIDAIPPMAEMKVVRYWDTGGTTTGDPSAGVKLAKHKKNGLYYVLDVVRGQWASEERRKMQRQTADLDYASPANNQVTQIQSEDPGAAGKDQAADFIKLMHGYSCKTMRETGEKTTRADAFSAQLNVGNVKLLRGDWNKAYIDELRMFPNGKNDDQVDASAGAFNWLENRSGKSFLPDGWKF